VYVSSVAAEADHVERGLQSDARHPLVFPRRLPHIPDDGVAPAVVLPDEAQSDALLEVQWAVWHYVAVLHPAVVDPDRWSVSLRTWAYERRCRRRRAEEDEAVSRE
jgi:hypothetical protein